MTELVARMERSEIRDFPHSAPLHAGYIFGPLTSAETG